MTDEEMVRKVVAINYEIVMTHGVEGGVGFVSNEIFIPWPIHGPAVWGI